MAITFQNTSIQFKLEEKLKLKKWIRQTALAEKKQCGQINFVFTNDEKLLKINIQYLDHDTYTDIITFDYSDKNTIEGDIMISIDRVKANADTFKRDFETELKRVMIHGVLHLCGYEDKTTPARTLMRKKENEALFLFKQIH